MNMTNPHAPDYLAPIPGVPPHRKTEFSLLDETGKPIQYSAIDQVPPEHRNLAVGGPWRAPQGTITR
jgi:hypothetical protein